MEAQFDDKAQGGNDRGAEQGGKAKGKVGGTAGAGDGRQRWLCRC